MKASIGVRVPVPQPFDAPSLRSGLLGASTNAEKGGELAEPHKKMHYLYLVLCKNNSIYAGVTDNIQKRFKRHKSGTGGWHTYLYPAIELLRVERFETKQEALKRERQIKGWRREKKINLIKFGKPIL